ncbi:MAG: GntR family transcriptional regulator [Solirubrobacteraceae bacterium]
MPICQTRAAAVTQELRRLIKTGELPPGSRLRQVEIAGRFGVSTTPVREAFTALTREGLIRHDTHRGAVVFPPTDADVRENFEIRLALEPLATEMAARNMNDAVSAALELSLRQLTTSVRRAATPRRSEQYERLDRQFHREIFAAAQRPRLAEMIGSLRDAAAAYAHLHTDGGPDQQLLEALQAQHEELVDTLRRGRPGNARRIAAAHVRLTASNLRPVDR